MTVPVTAADVSTAYTAAPATGPEVNPAWFALMRYDQVGTFAAAYASHLAEQTTRRRKSLHPDQALNEREIGEVERLAFDRALSEIVGELLALDWLPDEAKPLELGSQQAPQAPLSASILPTALAKMKGAERRDARRRLVWAKQEKEGRTDYLQLPVEVRTPPAWAEEQGYDVDAETGRLVDRTAPRQRATSSTAAAAVPSDDASVETVGPVAPAPSAAAGAAATTETTDATPPRPAE